MWLGVLLLALAVTDSASLYLRQKHIYHLDVGFWYDAELQLLDGVYQPEIDSAGTTYRWTSAQSSFTVRGFASVRHPMLHLSVGGLPPALGAPLPVHLSMDGTPLTLSVAAAARQYHVLLPDDSLADGNLHVSLASATARVPPDPRDVGLRLDDIAIGWYSGRAWPTWWTLAIQLAIVVTWLAVTWRLGLPRWSLFALAATLVVLLSWMFSYTLLIATAWQSRLMATSALVLALMWNADGLLERWYPELGTRREVRLLCILTVVAIGIRLFGLFHPAFASHDLYIHRDRLLDLQQGMVQLFDSPSEFGGRQTVVPPGFYLLVSPFTPLTHTPGVAIHAVYGLLDGTSGLLVAALVRNLGGSARAARIAALAILALPIQLTALWWGFAPQVVGQWLLLLLAVMLSRRTPATPALQYVAGIVLCLAFVTHNGVAILGGAWLAGYLLLEWYRRREHAGWRGWILPFGGALLVALLLVYGEAVQLQLPSGAGGGRPQRFDNLLRITLIGKGLFASLRPIGVPLAAACLLVLLLRIRGSQRRLVVAWLASAGLFLLVDVVLGLQVRYAYFAVPLVCAGLGLVLDQWMARGWWGRLLSWSLMGLIVWSGLSLWIEGTLFFVKPTLTALTH